eukprot:5353541-Amphidinium_carterae.1
MQPRLVNLCPNPALASCLRWQRGWEEAECSYGRKLPGTSTVSYDRGRDWGTGALFEFHGAYIDPTWEVESGVGRYCSHFLSESGVFVASERLEFFHQVHDWGMGHTLHGSADSDTLRRENNSDHQYHSKRKQNDKFQEHRHTPKYWKNEQNGVYQCVAASIAIVSGWRANVLDPKPLGSCQIEVTELYRVLGVDAAWRVVFGSRKRAR